MRFFQKLSSKVIILVLVVAVIGFIGLFVSQSFRIKEVQTQYENAQAGLQRIEDRNAKLKEHLDFYQNSPGYMLYVEKVARESLGMAKPNETVILPITDNNGTLQSSQFSAPTIVNNAPAPAPAHKANWQNWLGFFFGN